MRAFVAALVGVITLAAVSAAGAEVRVFVVANYPDGYGVDRCLSTGDSCGKAVASAYCRAREFEKAVSFRRVERGDITGTVPISANFCPGSSCDEFVAIECTR